MELRANFENSYYLFLSISVILYKEMSTQKCTSIIIFIDWKVITLMFVIQFMVVLHSLTIEKNCN